MQRAITIITEARIAALFSARQTDDAYYATWRRFDHEVRITIREVDGMIDVLITLPEIATDVEHALGALALCLEVTWLAGRVRAELGDAAPADDHGSVSGTRPTLAWRATG